MIKDLTVEGKINVNVIESKSGPYPCVGGIAGYVIGIELSEMSVLTDGNDTETGIIDCTSKVTINVTSGNSDIGLVSVGGIAGLSNGATIRDCENEGAVSVALYNGESGTDVDAGGIMGYSSYNTVISDCCNTGTLSVENAEYTDIGGVVGDSNVGSAVSNCYNTGAVIAKNTKKDSSLGGVVGENEEASVNNCYNTGDIIAENTESANAGGVVGENDDGSVSNCYNTGDVTAENVEYAAVGGVVGNVYEGTVSNCYNTGTVSGNENIGGVAGYNTNGTVSSCCYLEQGNLPGIDNDVDNTDATPLTQEQFADTDNFFTTWDFTNTWIIGTPSDGGFARPMLRYNLETAEGSGTESDPYIIPDLETLAFYRDMINAGSDSKYNSEHYKLTADIELNGSETNQWTPIGSDKDHAFTGTFDGDGYTISGLYINSDISKYGVAGLFGYVGGGGTVKNLNVEGIVIVSDNVSVSGTSTVGGVVGSSSGTVSSCNSSVKVSGAAAGGVVGINSGTVSNCTNTGNVTGTVSYFYAGGVVGSNDGTVENCYNTGKVSGNGFGAGGVVGQNNSDGTVENCYNTGVVGASGLFPTSGGVVGRSDGTVTNCYYLDTCGAGGSGTSKTAEEFASGDVAWLLQDGQDDPVWGQQNLGAENSLPMLTSDQSARVLSVTFNVSGESNPYAVKYTNYNGTVTFPENPTPPEDQVFDGWYSGDTKYESTTEFTVDTTLTAKFAAASTYTVTVNGSYAGETGAGSYIAGENVTVSAGERAGYSFAGWTAVGIDLADESAENVTFTMPANDVTLTAEWDYIVTPGDPTYRPIIDEPENGGVTTSPSRPEAGDTVTVNPEPDEGYEVDEIIVTDKDGNPVEVTRNPDGSYSFTQPKGAVTITFTPDSGLPFTDVNSGDWFYDYVEYVYANGLMDGTSDTTFEPNANMTRAMVWAILARIDGETVTGANWVETAREWAMANGVSDGTDANGYVTREQLATMLWRYAGEPASSYSLSAFTDAANVSGYAANAMAWAVEHGIISGVTDTTLVPQGTATRAQCAAMLMRFAEL